MAGTVHRLAAWLKYVGLGEAKYRRPCTLADMLEFKPPGWRELRYVHTVKIG
jgi:hypothetical protein